MLEGALVGSNRIALAVGWFGVSLAIRIRADLTIRGG
jgi:hypothetical protein